MATCSPAEIIIRAEAGEDAAHVVDIRNQPLVRWGTLALPYASVEHYRRRQETRSQSDIALVACFGGGNPVGSAGLTRHGNPRCAHVASLGVMVHDAHQSRGIGRALMAALIEMADEWLNLKRLELQVYTDNHRAITLYQSFGFIIEGTFQANSFRAGAFVDSHAMARLKF